MDNIVKFLKTRNELGAACDLLDVMAKYASTMEEFDNLANLYHEIKQYDKAVRYSEKAMAIAPTNETLYACRSNLAKLHNLRNRSQQALFYLALNERFNPNDYEVMMEQVFGLFLLNRKEEAEAVLQKLDAMPNLTEKQRNNVEFNLGTYDLYHGRFKEGLRKFILTGKKIGITGEITLPFPRWDGGTLPTKKMVVVGEGGIGDEVIGFRFCQHLKQLGVEPVWLTAGRKDLAQIFRRMGVRAYDTLADLTRGEGRDLVWCYSMLLPVYLELGESDLWHGAYLTPDQSHKAAWGESMDTPGMRVGLRWSGNPHYDHHLHRNLPLSSLYSAVAREGVTLYSLQRDEGAEQVKEFPAVINLSDRLASYEDTMGALANLDVVVTSCTSIAHVSAALGLRTIILVPIAAYYTWASTHDETSIWYGDNVTVLRQTEHNNWDGPLQRLAELLGGMMSTTATNCTGEKE